MLTKKKGKATRKRKEVSASRKEHGKAIMDWWTARRELADEARKEAAKATEKVDRRPEWLKATDILEVNVRHLCKTCKAEATDACDEQNHDVAAYGVHNRSFWRSKGMTGHYSKKSMAHRKKAPASLYTHEARYLPEGDPDAKLTRIPLEKP